MTFILSFIQEEWGRGHFHSNSQKMDISIKCIILLTTICLFTLCLGVTIDNEDIQDLSLNTLNISETHTDISDTDDLLAVEELLNYTELVRKPANFQRTQVFIYAITSPGEYIFIRGGKMDLLSYFKRPKY